MVQRSVQGIRPRNYQILDVEILEDRQVMSGASLLASLRLPLPSSPLSTQSALLATLSPPVTVAVGDAVVGATTASGLGRIGDQTLNVGVTFRLDQGGHDALALTAADALFVGSKTGGIIADTGLHLGGPAGLQVEVGVAPGQSGQGGITLSLDAKLPIAGGSGIRLDVGVGVPLGPGGGNSPTLLLGVDLGPSGSAAGDGSTKQTTSGATGGSSILDVLCGEPSGTTTMAVTNRLAGEVAPQLNLLLPPVNPPSGEKPAGLAGSPSESRAPFDPTAPVDSERLMEESLPQLNALFLPATRSEAVEPVDLFFLSVDLQEVVKLVEFVGLGGQDVASPAVQVQGIAGEQRTTGNGGEILVDDAELVPQNADLLTGCTPFEVSSLDRLLEQFHEGLGCIGGELAGGLAHLGLHPSILLLLAMATVTAEIARRNLRKSPSPVADLAFGLWPQETL
jgi:hypothetical protein